MRRTELDFRFMTMLRKGGLSEDIIEKALGAKEELKVGHRIVSDIEVRVALIPETSARPTEVEISTVQLS